MKRGCHPQIISVLPYYFRFAVMTPPGDDDGTIRLLRQPLRAECAQD
jgi:hypothetical protein